MDVSSQNRVADSSEISGVESDRRMQKLKPPSRKLMHEDLDKINSLISLKDTELKSLQQIMQDGDNLIKNYHSERDSLFQEKQKALSSLNCLTKEIADKNGSLTQLKSNLHYKSEEKLNDSIRRLEYQLKNQNFKLSDEKKIVDEIDKLKRSKKVLSQYLVKNKEMEELRTKQKKMRTERDGFIRKENELKSKENEYKKSSVNNRTRCQSLKQEISELKEAKQKVVSEFKNREKDFNERRELQRELHRKQRLENVKQRESGRELKHRELKYQVVKTPPYNTQLHTCSTLAQYLQNFTVHDNDGNVSHNSQLSNLNDLSADAATVLRGLNMEQFAEQEGVFLLQQKNNDNPTQNVGKKSRRSSRHRKSTLSKPLTHTPSIFEQFISVGLTPPSNMHEVPVSLTQLDNKKKQFELLNIEAEQQQMAASCDPEVNSAEVSLSSSKTSSLTIGSEVSIKVERQASTTESAGSSSDSKQNCDSVVDLLSFTEPIHSSVSPTDFDRQFAPECDLTGSAAEKDNSVTKSKDITSDDGHSEISESCVPTAVITSFS